MAIYTRKQTPPTPADPPGPPGKWYPWYDGLGNVCTPCPLPMLYCPAIGGSIPKYLYVTISGVVQATTAPCADCTSINGDHILTYTGTGFPPAYCYWKVEYPGQFVCDKDYDPGPKNIWLAISNQSLIISGYYSWWYNLKVGGRVPIVGEQLYSFGLNHQPVPTFDSSFDITMSPNTSGLAGCSGGHARVRTIPP